MKKCAKDFYRGFAVAAGFVCRQGGQARLEEIFTQHGVTWKMLKEAECDDYDLDNIKNSMSKYELKCIGYRK